MTGPSHEKHIYAAFHSLSLKDIVGSKGHLLAVDDDVTLRQTLDVMNRHKVLSVAMRNKATGEYSALVNMFDIVSYVVTSSSVDDAVGHKINEVPGINQESVSVPHMTSNEKFEDLLVKFSHGFHRVLLEVAPKAYTLLTQSDVARWLYRHRAKLSEESLNESLESAGLVPEDRKVISVGQTSNVVDAFRLMFKHDVRAVAVTNEEGAVVGNLSASDLRECSAERMKLLLNWDVKSFLEDTHGGKIPAAVTVSPSTTVGDAIKTAVEGHIHRVWVVSDEGKAAGVATLTDLIMKFSPVDYS